MKLGITLLVIGLAGTLAMFGAAINVGDWYLYSSVWPLIAGVAFFMVFLYGYYRFRKAVRKRNAERNRRW